MSEYLNDSLVHQINVQSEDLARQMIEYEHRIESRISEIQRAALEIIKLHKLQVGVSDSIQDPKKSTLEAIDMSDKGLGSILETLLQTSSSLIHSVQESSMDGMSVHRLKHQVLMINKLLDDLGI